MAVIALVSMSIVSSISEVHVVALCEMRIKLILGVAHLARTTTEPSLATLCTAVGAIPGKGFEEHLDDSGGASSARSATIWASSRTRDPYFEILGAPRGIMVTPSGGFARCSTFGSRHGKA